ncbi:MAG: hypothetical protein A3B13_01200 [Candidatus Liptonbacteria bacterium RIFCSPLOWO2_01_FULL_45_15]|uniref:Uncharacterized protein n=1 Tax=Candidatus Liptonbacteria bacterium RIFCSPLOWO2_01_FULL_45_15 TaxID=1798649 RepID=A0A1G2CG20_9BACT|nr:MAG: hypothetical protein A3B13_01200 [Candidatus Liptonbacteria bacterium RIFCSPLOWO2_01_FULL_45_15]
MLKEFEQPVDEKINGEISEAERDALIEAKVEWLQALMDRACTTVKMARVNKLLSKSKTKALYGFLNKINEEIAVADENSADINETLARLEELGNKLKLPTDIKTENIGKLLEEKDAKIFSKNGEIFLGTLDDDRPEQQVLHPVAPEIENAEHQTVPINVSIRRQDKTGRSSRLFGRGRNGSRNDGNRRVEHPANE